MVACRDGAHVFSARSCFNLSFDAEACTVWLLPVMFLKAHPVFDFWLNVVVHCVGRWLMVMLLQLLWSG